MEVIIADGATLRFRRWVQGYRRPVDESEGGWLDAELMDTFPASDPLPHWPGPPRPLDDADRAHRRPRQHRSADELPGRSSPSDARRGTLPHG
jgi:hypothetical protein